MENFLLYLDNQGPLPSHVAILCCLQHNLLEITRALLSALCASLGPSRDLLLSAKPRAFHAGRWDVWQVASSRLRAQARRTDVPGFKPYFHHLMPSCTSFLFFTSCFVTDMNAEGPGWWVAFEHKRELRMSLLWTWTLKLLQNTSCSLLVLNSQVSLILQWLSEILGSGVTERLVWAWGRQLSCKSQLHPLQMGDLGSVV